MAHVGIISYIGTLLLDNVNKANNMSNFNKYFNNNSQRYFFESRYEDVSEPPKE